MQGGRDGWKEDQLLEDTLASTKLIYNEAEGGLGRTQSNLDSSTITTITLPSIVVDEMDELNDDDPPPYSAIAPPNHIGWPFGFSSGIGYSACGGTQMPLATFQTPLVHSTASSPPPPPPPPPPLVNFHQEGANGQHAAITMPLMPYRIFKCGSHRSLFLPRVPPFSDDTSITKVTENKTRRYGTILVAAVVIIFLMILSLLVRFVIEKSFWRR